MFILRVLIVGRPLPPSGKRIGVKTNGAHGKFTPDASRRSSRGRSDRRQPNTVPKVRLGRDFICRGRRCRWRYYNRHDTQKCSIIIIILITIIVIIIKIIIVSECSNCNLQLQRRNKLKNYYEPLWLLLLLFLFFSRSSHHIYPSPMMTLI